MRSKFDEQLKLLHDEMIQMCSMIENAIQGATRAFMNMDVDLARRIMDGDADVDSEQKKIENICFNLLIQRQPVARDLRLVTASLKVVTDIERIGDHCSDMAELLIRLEMKDLCNYSSHIKEMIEETKKLEHAAVDAFVNRDVSAAQKVINGCDVVDDLFI